MANLFNGLPRDEIKGQGGIKAAYFAPFSGVTYSGNTNGVANFSVGAGEFKPFVFGKDSASNYGEVETVNVANGSITVEQTLNLVFKRNTVSKRNELKVMAVNELIGVIEDNNDQVWMFGATRGLDLVTNTTASGNLYADANSMTVVIKGTEKELAPSVSAAEYLQIKAGLAVS